MSFCEHCAGQRYDRSQVLRTLRAARRRLQEEEGPCPALEALDAAIGAVRALDIPHFDPVDEEVGDDTVIH